MTPQFSPTKAPAERLVLFVADGLRADKFFEFDYYKGSRAPFLRSIIENKGVWGVSHTRVPTESRPGHVAMIAGFYEDVSAVTKGWKKNPVDFDSVFNESVYTWSWGSPDILPMFAENVDHVATDMYDPHMEDFGKDASVLDTWVFERVERLFKENKDESGPQWKMLHSEKVVFFLHLLGIDTNGHAFRPTSEEYYHNIRTVDQGIKKLHGLFEEYYGDGKTAYIFTADHGISNKGSHGDGERANTETPLVCWGSGINRPIPKKNVTDGYTPSEWYLDHLKRMDVNQADIAPLMSTLIGVPPPLNSVGVLPTSFLAADQEFKTKNLFTNAKQILAQFYRKSELKKETTLWFKDYAPLHNGTARVTQIEQFINAGQYQQAEILSLELIELAVNGLNYFQKYDWLFLMSIICIGYAGWMAVVALFILKTYTQLGTSFTNKQVSWNNAYDIVNITAIGIVIVLTALLSLQSSPLLYYLYCLFPIVFWAYVGHERKFISHIWSTLSRSSIMASLFYGVLSVIFLEIMVVGYFHRFLFSIGSVCLCLWPLVGNFKASGRLGLAWCISCCIMAIFPLLPIDMGENITLVAIGGLITFLVGAIYYKFYQTTTVPKERALFGLKVLLVLVATIVTVDTDRNLAAKAGLPYVNQMIAWAIFGGSFLQLFTGSKHYYDYYMNLFMCLAAPYILFSISFEILFYFSLGCTLLIWLKIEEQTRLQTDKAGVTLHDVRSGLFYLFFYYISFFGTGNIASMSSFEVSSTYRFTTVFDPFLMGALLIWKVLIPLFVVACLHHTINRRLVVSEPGSLFIVVALAEIMTVNFFFLVQDYGSWKDIGTSISHFGLASAVIVVQLILGSIANMLLSGLYFEREKQHSN